MEKPQLDESKATEYIGRTILLGVTYVDDKEKPIGQRQWFGTILTFNNTHGIKVKLSNSDLPCCLPADPRAICKAKPGVYRLRSTGEEILNPDYLARWVSTRPGINETSDFLPPGA
jgi:hypothetical protein